MEQHVLVEFELDPGVVEELASGRTGGWLGWTPRPRARSPLGWRGVVRPIWPIVLLIGLTVAGVRALSMLPTAVWAPVVFDLVRLALVAIVVGSLLALGLRMVRRAR